MNCLSAISCLALVGASLPMPTASGVCPAIAFTSDTHEENGELKIAFMPDSDAYFEFVDLHIVARDGQQKNVPMTRTAPNMPYVGSVPSTFADWEKYSFTYCTPINGKPVDCDTEHMLLIEYFWDAMPLPCPTDCGLPASSQEQDVLCIGTDGNIHSEQMCPSQLRPSSVFCPATVSCIEYFWQPEQVQCPTVCGMQEHYEDRPVMCMGTDGQPHAHNMCAGLVKPPAVLCPATTSCITYYWSVQPAACDMRCGIEAAYVEGEKQCTGTDGMAYTYSMCDGLALPEADYCPATDDCSWLQGSVQCSTACGQQQQMVDVELNCVDESGLSADFSRCSMENMPSPQVACPATAACLVTPQPQMVQMVQEPACGSEGNPCFIQSRMEVMQRELPVMQVGKVGKRVGKVGKVGKRVGKVGKGGGFGAGGPLVGAFGAGGGVFGAGGGAFGAGPFASGGGALGSGPFASGPFASAGYGYGGYGW